uniref:Coiled-coil domain containing 142 n=1 Tax=Maylandia zebra TaxID=106582 RepID=A0A3P9CL42_9CICH|nr:coiled-coil domain-containing protein 142 isoform X1 [Maylandia zebra]XP_012778857.2 coiled-coil domain-containing protein 142 isoform X1 [Maylandia zebra]
MQAEVLIRSSFNPSLKWLFWGHGQDQEEKNFVVAHNLVSRSSERLLRLQQALLSVAPQWQLVASARLSQVCFKGMPDEAGVLLLPSSSSLQGKYRAQWRLLEQRSLLIFIHEYTRRARLAAVYISSVSRLLEHHRQHLAPQQTPSTSCRLDLGSLSQELRVHLNHWSCLFSKVQSDHFLRRAAGQHTRLLLKIKESLDLLGLQALVLMEHYVQAILSSVFQTDLDSVPKEVLEDILTGTYHYNQVVDEQRGQHSASKLKTAVMQQAHFSTLDSSLPRIKSHRPSPFSVKELMMILASYHAEMAAKQLHYWASEPPCYFCQIHSNHETCTCAQNPTSLRSGISTLRSEWTWEQLHYTYLISSPLFSISRPTLQMSCQNKNTTLPVYTPDVHLNKPVVENRPSVSANPADTEHKEENSKREQSNRCQKRTSHSAFTQSGVEALDLVQPDPTRLESGALLQTASPLLMSSQRLRGVPPSRICQPQRSSAELLFQVFVSSSDLLAPLVSHTPTPERLNEQPLQTPATDVVNGKVDSTILSARVPNTPDPVELDRESSKLNKDQNVERIQQEWAELEITVPDPTSRSEKEEMFEADTKTLEPDLVCWSHSVQWLDLGESLVFADLLEQYHTLLRAFCSRALWLQLQVPVAGHTAGSLNLQEHHRGFQVIHRLCQASDAGQVPKESEVMLEDLSLCVLLVTAHAQWDYELCRTLGSTLTDKCLINQRSSFVVTSSEKDENVTTSATMGRFLLLLPPLLSSLRCRQSHSRASGPFSLFPCTLQRQTVGLVLASVQLPTVWVMSKAHQFLSSWSLNKFLLITQGDLTVMRESFEAMVHQTKSLVMNSHSDQQSALHTHSQLLLQQQLETLERARSALQTFSSVMLRTFSSDCKQRSGEIFEHTMPPAVHWKPSHRTGFPNSPSEYASLAAQTVIGQVLEGVAPLSDDARVQALSITMTAFMEAWMEHILRQKIKFSVQGALQLKQDFDSIREMIQSNQYGLSAELHQQLLSLRVFQQVDSAVVCLLQQPQAKPYVQSRSWEPFSRCCPADRNGDSTDAAVGSSIANLRCMEGEDLPQSDSSCTPTDLPPVDPSTPAEPYLAPSLVLGAAQQDWLDLRIQTSARRWRLPGLSCLSNSEH